jgi:3',5'-cyclic-nucleotide phosphodiesterase
VFMLTVRSCYQSTNHYHNFKHAVDVLQATFQILVLSNIVPPLNSPNAPHPESLTPLLPAGYITPIEVLALCIAAVGHDAAHPGVTNAFLAASGSSLATIFNERSILENLHCLTISRIVGERWPSLFADKDGHLRRLVLEMILSTDMALHFDFMARFEALRNSISSDPIDEKQRRLICCCIMKSADISNLVVPFSTALTQARPLSISTDWTLVLQKEVSAQEDLVETLNISLAIPMSPTTTRGTTQSAEEQESQLAKSQLGFIDMFAEPLWNIGAQLFFPGMTHGVNQIRENRQLWMSKVKPPPNDGANSSVSTATSGTTGKSEGTVPTPRTPNPVGEGVRKVLSSSDLNEDGRKRDVRKERSFSSLIFWRKRAGQKSQRHD